MPIIIKKNVLKTIIHIVVFVGIVSVLLWILRILYYMIVVDFSWYGILLSAAIIYRLLITGRTVISCIRFGMKQCTINKEGIIYYSWKMKKLSWKEIKKIKLSVSCDLLLYTKNKKIKIDMGNTLLEVDPDKVYKQCKRYHENALERSK